MWVSEQLDAKISWQEGGTVKKTLEETGMVGLNHNPLMRGKRHAMVFFSNQHLYCTRNASFTVNCVSGFLREEAKTLKGLLPVNT